MHDFLPNARPLSAAELDHRLEKAVQDHERAEKLICFYLYQIKRRGHYRVFGRTFTTTQWSDSASVIPKRARSCTSR